MCCSNITHCLSVQKYWTKFSPWCKQRQFREHFWCHAYLFILTWPTIRCINYIKWLRGICLNSCKQRKYSSRASGVASSHIAGAGVLRAKFDRLDSKQERKVRATHTMWNGALFQAKVAPQVPGYGGSSWLLPADVSFPSRSQKGDQTQLLKTWCQA